MNPKFAQTGNSAKFSAQPRSHRFFIEPSNFPCRTLADYTEEEILSLEKQYGCPVRRPQRRKK
jgi:hypothetical protein